MIDMESKVMLEKYNIVKNHLGDFYATPDFLFANFGVSEWSDIENLIDKAKEQQAHSEHIKEELKKFSIKFEEKCIQQNNPYIKFFLHKVLNDFERYCQEQTSDKYTILY